MLPGFEPSYDPSNLCSYPFNTFQHRPDKKWFIEALGTFFIEFIRTDLVQKKEYVNFIVTLTFFAAPCPWGKKKTESGPVLFCVALSHACALVVCIKTSVGRFLAPVDWKRWWGRGSLIREETSPLYSCDWMVICIVDLWMIKVGAERDYFNV